MGLIFDDDNINIIKIYKMGHDTLMVIGIVLVLVALLAYPIALYNSAETKKITVQEKWMKVHQDQGKYLVSDTEGNVYAIQDSVWLWKFDASDRYARVEANNTYNITTYGWRVRILSWYPNILALE